MTYSADVFPARLRALRRRHGLTQEQLGNVLGVHVTAICQYERGSRAPTLGRLCDFANALGVEPGALLFLPEITEQEPQTHDPTDQYRSVRSEGGKL